MEALQDEVTEDFKRFLFVVFKHNFVQNSHLDLFGKCRLEKLFGVNSLFLSFLDF